MPTLYVALDTSAIEAEGFDFRNSKALAALAKAAGAGDVVVLVTDINDREIRRRIQSRAQQAADLGAVFIPPWRRPQVLFWLKHTAIYPYPSAASRPRVDLDIPAGIRRSAYTFCRNHAWLVPMCRTAAA